MTLTVESLKENLAYDPLTGLFTRVKDKGPWKAGSVAGSRHHSGYITVFVCGKYYTAHRLAWFYTHGYFPDLEIDHINRVRSDNRLSNLRLVTRTQNMHNYSGHSLNSSGFTGVSLNKRKKWRATVNVNKTWVELGTFETPKEAAAAYKGAKRVIKKFLLEM